MEHPCRVRCGSPVQEHARDSTGVAFHGAPRHQAHSFEKRCSFSVLQPPKLTPDNPSTHRRFPKRYLLEITCESRVDRRRTTLPYRGIHTFLAHSHPPARAFANRFASRISHLDLPQ